jgi:hypothetical protein
MSRPIIVLVGLVYAYVAVDMASKETWGWRSCIDPTRSATSGSG